jgi:hypothetical protein
MCAQHEHLRALAALNGHAVVSAPLNVLFTLGFLYAVLGPASLAGLAVMVALFPVPTRVGALLGRYQAQRMAAVRCDSRLRYPLADVLQMDARVQAATDALSVLRTVKLLALERRVARDVGAAREAELKFIVWTKMAELLINCVKCVVCGVCALYGAHDECGSHLILLVHMLVSFTVYVR